MEAKTHVRITNKVLMYDTTVEQEQRYEMDIEDFRAAVKGGIIKIYDTIKIEQIWFGKSDKYTARIRKTTAGFGNNVSKINYEHTVKHHIKRGMDYEVTTDIVEKDYTLLEKLYKDEKYQSKLRVYVRAVDGSDENYIVTVDIPDDKPTTCYVEFELKDAGIDESKINETKFIKPAWVKVKRK